MKSPAFALANIHNNVNKSAEEPTYELLVNHFSKIAQPTVQDIKLAAHAAYAWMPRMIGKLSNDQILRAYAEMLPNVQRSNAIETLRHIQRPIVSNSWVGTSKTLHFLKPDVFAIWDSRVAKVFGLKHQYQYNDSNAYFTYLELLYAILDEPMYDTIIAERPAITSIRSLERLFYDYAKLP